MRASEWSCIVVAGLGLGGCKIENVRPAEENPAGATSTETLDALTSRIEALEEEGRVRDETLRELQAALAELEDGGTSGGAVPADPGSPGVEEAAAPEPARVSTPAEPRPTKAPTPAEARPAKAPTPAADPPTKAPASPPARPKGEKPAKPDPGPAPPAVVPAAPGL